MSNKRMSIAILILLIPFAATFILGACATTSPGESESPWRSLARQAVTWGVVCALAPGDFNECLSNQARSWLDGNVGGLLGEWLANQDPGLDPVILEALGQDLVGGLLGCALSGKPEGCLRDWGAQWTAANAPALADLIGNLLDRLIFGEPPQALRADRFVAELATDLPVWIATCAGDPACARTIAEGWAYERFPTKAWQAGDVAQKLTELAKE